MSHPRRLSVAAPAASALFAPLLALAGLAPVVAAAPPGQETALHAPDGDQESADRILHLSNGTVLRARAERLGGLWRVRSKAGWSELPPGVVREAVLEKDLLAEMRQRERELGSRPRAEQRSALGAWELAAGLHTEGLRELDRALAMEPDEPGAVAALAEHGPTLALPAVSDARRGAESFLRTASELTPATRELALRSLASVEREALRERLSAELLHRMPGRRAFAGLALRRLFPGDALKPLMQRAVLDASEDVRLQASLALRAANEPATVVPVVRALGSQSSTVRMQASEALGWMGYASGVEALISSLASGGDYRPTASHVFVGAQRAYVQDYDVEVAQFEAIGDPQVSVLLEGAVLDARVLATNASTATSVQHATARKSLSRLTGASPGHSSAAWQTWWQENGDAWRTRAAAESARAEPGS